MNLDVAIYKIMDLDRKFSKVLQLWYFIKSIMMLKPYIWKANNVIITFSTYSSVLDRQSKTSISQACIGLVEIELMLIGPLFTCGTF